ncbi:MAG TPA: hypothetical protein VMB50_12060 [Myxococcales bacterium]|nr:hypothetical protein [Myxococcales bacterium]
MTVRRAAATLFLGLFVALLVASAGHDHFRHDDLPSTTACLFCNPALAVHAATPPLPLPPPPRRERGTKPFRAPALPYLLKLDHSGGAPPAA